MVKFSKELFMNLNESGRHQVFASPQVNEYMGDDQQKHNKVTKLLARYFTCDWGEDIENDEEDKTVNNNALKTGGRILGVYYIDDIKFFIMTNPQWTITEVMFADEY